MSDVQEQMYNCVSDLVCTNDCVELSRAAIKQRISLFHSWGKLHSSVVKALKDKRGSAVQFVLHDRSVDIQELCRRGKGANVADIKALVSSIEAVIAMVKECVAEFPEYTERRSQLNRRVMEGQTDVQRYVEWTGEHLAQLGIWMADTFAPATLRYAALCFRMETESYLVFSPLSAGSFRNPGNESHDPRCCSHLYSVAAIEQLPEV